MENLTKPIQQIWHGDCVDLTKNIPANVDAKRFLKNNGSCIFFYDWKNLSVIIDIAEKHDFIVKDMIRYEKSNPMPRNRDSRYITDFECAVWFTKSKKMDIQSKR